MVALVAALRLDADEAREFASAARGKPEPAVMGRPAWVKLAVLGPLAVWWDDDAVELGPPSQRALLGVLALSPNEPVRRETLIDAWWGDEPPPSAVNQIQARVSGLRRILDPGRPARDRGGLLASAGTSYRLRVTTGQLDLLAFRDLVGRADAARRGGEVAAACGLYERALRLWRGDPLADVSALRQHPAVTGLSEQRWAAVVSYAESACELGRYDQVLPLVWPLTEREPLHEAAHAVLMIALAGTGRQAAALEVFETLQRRLDEQLGVCPGRELTRAHMRVLRADLPAPCPAPPTAANPQGGRLPGSKATAESAVPRQMPAASRHFVGRASELAALNELLDEPRYAAATVVISAIGGTAGVGKTALAMHWAHQVAPRFPDGQLYANLRGFGPSARPVTPARALRGFLDALGVPPARIPRDLDAQVGLYRSLLAGKRMLIVLDNARNAAQVRPLLPGSPGALAVVTSRSRLVGLAAADGARLLDLDVLAPEEARDLLAAHLGAGRLAAEPQATAEIINVCGRLPLALAIWAARAAARPFPLSALAGELRQDPLDALAAGGDPAADVRAVFAWSYRALTPQAARLFRLLGLSPGPDISTPAAASLAGVPPPRARVLLTELVDAHLIREDLPRRYTLHDLLRAYAAGQASLIDAESQRRAAIDCLLDHYAHTAHTAAFLLNPFQRPVSIDPPRAGVIPEEPADQRQALAWFAAEHPILLAAIDYAAGAERDAHAWQLAWALETFHDRQGHWHELEATQRAALAAARRLGDPQAAALAHRNLAHACSLLGRPGDAHAHLGHALDLYRQAGDQSGQAGTHNCLSHVYAQQGRHAPALDHARRAFALYQAIGHPAGQPIALNNIGWACIGLGDHEQAITCCQQALALIQQGDHDTQADTWDCLGHAHHHLGHHDQAAACYRHALALYQRIGDRYSQAATINRLGDTRDAAGDHGAAHRTWQQALTILDDLDHPDSSQVRAKLAAHHSSPSGAPRPL